MKLPIWTSHYSFGKSIVTLEKKGSSKKTGPDSIIDLCLDNNIKDVYLIEDNLSSFIQAYENCNDAGLNLRYGLRLTMTNDASKLDEDSLKSNHKLIIWALSTQGYYDLIRIYSKAACNFKYYEPRMDYKVLKELWTENLAASIPFYDSFLFRNNLLGGAALPDLFFKPSFFFEKNGLPFDDILRTLVSEYCFANDIRNFQEVQTIYYTRCSDLKTYMAYRCIGNRATISRPQLEGFCSDSFCLENYLDATKK